MAKVPFISRRRRANTVHPSTTDGKRTSRLYGEKVSPEKKTAFLAVLATPLGTPTAASRAIGIDRKTAYAWKKKDPEFSAAWDEACEESVDQLEGEAKRRGFEGINKPVTVAGEREVIREYSDTLLKLVLQGRRQKVFGTQRMEHTGEGGGAIQHDVRVEFVRAKK